MTILRGMAFPFFLQIECNCLILCRPALIATSKFIRTYPFEHKASNHMQFFFRSIIRIDEDKNDEKKQFQAKNLLLSIDSGISSIVIKQFLPHQLWNPSPFLHFKCFHPHLNWCRVNPILYFVYQQIILPNEIYWKNSYYFINNWHNLRSVANDCGCDYTKPMALGQPHYGNHNRIIPLDSPFFLEQTQFYNTFNHKDCGVYACHQPDFSSCRKNLSKLFS